MSTPMSMQVDIRGVCNYGLSISQDSYSVTMPVSTVKTFTTPSTYSKWSAVINYDSGITVWMSVNDTSPSLPTGTVTKVNSMIPPSVLTVNAGDTLSFITDEASCELNVAFYYIK